MLLSCAVTAAAASTQSGVASAKDFTPTSGPTLSAPSISLAEPRANGSAGLLKAFGQAGVAGSQNKLVTLSAGRDVRRVSTDASKLNVASENVHAVAVPEPTALFIAGFAGCMLLAVAQRLRGSRVR